MRPYYSDDWLTVYLGDCRAVLAEMPAESVHCVVTSPPYWGLRDYGQAGQLGLEPTPEAYVENMVAVFREVRRVLRSDGTVWLNLGDSYAGSWGANGRGERTNAPRADLEAKHGTNAPNRNVPGLKPKDLVGIPWRVAFALQADGWYLRSDIIWSKPNPMPESVTDRPTKSHEYLFLLAKSARYYFDADAVREPSAYPPGSGWDDVPRGGFNGKNDQDGSATDGAFRAIRAARNIRSVWTIATAPYPGAHFATFPPKLVEPCIKAGCPDKVCGECGAGWERVVERPEEPDGLRNRGNGAKLDYHTRQTGSGQKLQDWMDSNPKTTTGWRPTCDHAVDIGVYEQREPLRPVPGVVLDPFAGSGTTGMVAQSLSRRAVLIDLSMDYLEQLMERNQQRVIGL